MSAVSALGRLRVRGAGADRYAVCPEDGFWFRPLYTDGKCPLCGEEIASGAPALPWRLRIDRFVLALGALALVSVAMCTLVLILYFR